MARSVVLSHLNVAVGARVGRLVGVMVGRLVFIARVGFIVGDIDGLSSFIVGAMVGAGGLLSPFMTGPQWTMLPVLNVWVPAVDEIMHEGTSALLSP